MRPRRLSSGEMEPTQTAPVVIAPGRGWVGPGLRELWQHRDLGFFLIWRDLKVRYKQTFFGVAWAILQPVLMMVVFTVFLGQVAGIAPAGVPYPLFALAGLVPWTLFSQSLIGASNSLVNSQNLISKVYFPRLLLPIAAWARFVVDFLIALVVLLVVTPLFGFPLTVTILWLPVVRAARGLRALAVGTWLAAINVRYRDVRYAMPFLVQIWLFASPVAYSITLVPENAPACSAPQSDDRRDRGVPLGPAGRGPRADDADLRLAVVDRRYPGHAVSPTSGGSSASSRT